MKTSRLLSIALPAAVGVSLFAAPPPAPVFPDKNLDAEFFAAFRTQVIGEAPPVVPPEVKIDSTEKMDGYTRQKISYNVDRDERVSAWLLIPDHAEGAKLPLVFCLHPTSGNGKDMVIDFNQHPRDEAERRKFEARSYGLDLVKRGFVCFAPDRAGFGERGPDPQEKNPVTNMRNYQKLFQARYPNWHWIFGKVPYDLSRALDFLVELDFIDAGNVGAIGHSLGGWDALYFYGSDARVKAAVTNSGGAHNFIAKLWTDQPTRLAFAAKKLQIKPDTDSSAQVFIMMGAPRALLYIRAVNDSGTDYPSSVMENVKLVAQYFRSFAPHASFIAGSPQFAAFFHNEGHDFPPFARELAYAWLARQLKTPSGNQ